eukprot:6198013-Karenia_brevis.AAC.1
MTGVQAAGPQPHPSSLVQTFTAFMSQNTLVNFELTMDADACVALVSLPVEFGTLKDLRKQMPKL